MLPREVFHLLFHVAQVVEDRHALGENSSALKASAHPAEDSRPKFPWRCVIEP